MCVCNIFLTDLINAKEVRKELHVISTNNNDLQDKCGSAFEDSESNKTLWETASSSNYSKIDLCLRMLFLI